MRKRLPTELLSENLGSVFYLRYSLGEIEREQGYHAQLDRFSLFVANKQIKFIVLLHLKSKGDAFIQEEA